jgi:hypothetical protein
MTDHDRSSNRQYDEETHGRRRLERGSGDRDDQMRGGLGDEERWRMDARDSWRQRERASGPAGGRDWQQPRDPYYGGSPRFVGERGESQWSPRGDYGQGGYWESEASSQGGQRAQGRQDYGQRGPWGQPDRQDYGGPWGQQSGQEFGRGAQDVGQAGWGQARQGGWGQDDPSGQGTPDRRGPHAGRGPKGYQRSDERIREDLCERLTQHGQLDAGDMEIKVHNREVTLTGTVQNRQAKRLAEDIAEAISGVSEVHNQLRISAEASGQQSHAGVPKPGKESSRAA